MVERGALEASPATRALLDQEESKLANEPRSSSMPRMSLLRIINRMSSQFEESFVKELNRKLNAIPKPAREGEA